MKTFYGIYDGTADIGVEQSAPAISDRKSAVERDGAEQSRVKACLECAKVGFLLLLAWTVFGLLLITAWGAPGSARAEGAAAHSVVEYGNGAVLRRQCTLNDWNYRLHVGTGSSAADAWARAVLIKAPAQDGSLWTKRYRAEDLFVLDCDAEGYACTPAKARSLHFRLGPEALPSAGVLMLVSAKRELAVQRFRVRMEEPDHGCRSAMRF